MNDMKTLLFHLSHHSPRFMPTPASSLKWRAGFSLVEVVLAIGIVSFAVLTILGLFGGIINSVGDNTERRTILEAVDSMRGHLITQGFDTAYGWVRTNQEFVFVTYKAGPTGSPDANGQRVLGRWMMPTDPDLALYEATRVGRWVRAKLSVSPSNPAGIALPPDANNYESGVLAVLAEMDSVETPSLPLPSNPRIKTTIGITR